MRPAYLSTMALWLASAGLTLAQAVPQLPYPAPGYPVAQTVPSQAPMPALAGPGPTLVPGPVGPMPMPPGPVDGPAGADPDGRNAFDTTRPPPRDNAFNPDDPDKNCPPCLWFSAEYLLWWVKEAPLPVPLVTAGSTTFLGRSDIFYDARSGSRVTTGCFLDSYGMEASAFFLGRRSATKSAGNIWFTSPNFLWGFEANGLVGRYFLAGFRYLEMTEDIDLFQNGNTSGIGGANVRTPRSQGFANHYGTINRYYGGQVGAHYETEYEIFKFYLVGKIGCGTTRESVIITPPTAIRNARTGHDVFTVVPEGEVKVECRLASHVHAFASYTIIYWSETARPGDQIVRQLPVKGSDFWVQGAGFGLEFRY